MRSLFCVKPQGGGPSAAKKRGADGLRAAGRLVTLPGMWYSEYNTGHGGPKRLPRPPKTGYRNGTRGCHKKTKRRKELRSNAKTMLCRRGSGAFAFVWNREERRLLLCNISRPLISGSAVRWMTPTSSPSWTASATMPTPSPTVFTGIWSSAPAACAASSARAPTA